EAGRRQARGPRLQVEVEGEEILIGRSLVSGLVLADSAASERSGDGVEQGIQVVNRSGQRRQARLALALRMEELGQPQVVLPGFGRLKVAAVAGSVGFSALPVVEPVPSVEAEGGIAPPPPAPNPPVPHPPLP